MPNNGIYNHYKGQLKGGIMKSYMTIDETADYFQINRTTITEWERLGLKRVKIGRRVYFDSEDIKDFMNVHKECRYAG